MKSHSVKAKLKMPRIFCYSPYNAWELHGLYEITILHALRLGGAEIKHVLCNGVFSACDMHWDATLPRHELSCVNCQATTSRLSSVMRMPFTGLSKYIDSNEYAQFKEFIDNLLPENYIEAIILTFKKVWKNIEELSKK